VQLSRVRHSKVTTRVSTRRAEWSKGRKVELAVLPRRSKFPVQTVEFRATLEELDKSLEDAKVERSLAFQLPARGQTR
jgi:hypothetical protein